MYFLISQDKTHLEGIQVMDIHIKSRDLEVRDNIQNAKDNPHTREEIQVIYGGIWYIYFFVATVIMVCPTCMGVLQLFFSLVV